ncbi:NAD(P)/FAD-dependent oxidoreductase [Microbacterium sp.]|uniref:NAD(P)/FAD-dependent oxidoreductase n=1 Tax=Microbacterium sp. TaxID=51671 RepID=UPI0039E61A01
MNAPGRHVVIVGASLAGTKTAQGLRAVGFDGSITLIGAEEELPYDRPPLSKDLLKTGWSEDFAGSVRLATEEELRDLGVDVLLGNAATSLDTGAKTVRLTDGAEIAYDLLVIATGAAARPSPWRPESGVYQLRTLEDAKSIADRLERGGSLVVVGGGFIGTEIAAAACSRGCEVIVVDPIPEPMTRLVGPEVAGSLVELHRRNGAQTRFGVGVVDIEGAEGDLTITLADGETLHADAVVVGIGSVPHTDWLDGSSLTVDNGVVTDGFLRAVGVDDVYALGDVARWPHPGRGALVRAEHWTNAGDQARYLAEAIVNGTDSPYAPTDYVWSDQYDWKVHAVGWRDPEGTSIVLGSLDEDGRVAVVHADAEGNACGAVTVNWVRALNHLRRLLAAGGTAEEIVEQLRQRA